MKYLSHFLMSLTAIVAVSACSVTDTDISLPGGQEEEANRQKMSFDVKVTRDGELVQDERRGVMTRGASAEGSEKTSTMDTNIPFGLIGIDRKNSKLLIDNASIKRSGNTYEGLFDSYFWDPGVPIQISAYYPRVNNIDYGDSYESYSIPFTVSETEAGPLVSKTVERALNQLNMIPLEFQHITNDIGFKICDATPTKELQGLIHLRKLTATNVAQQGVFLNDLGNGRTTWSRQAYYRKVVVFEGDAPVGVGSENELFVGFEELVPTMRESHRYYSIPDEIEIGKQCVEVVYDIDEFTLGTYTYPALKNQVAKYMLYGLLPDNVFEYGKQYTFHIGLDLSSVYHEITFAPSVGDWETKIYENNDTF